MPPTRQKLSRSPPIPTERAFLAGISPYNNLKPDVKYPEPLIFTTTKDDRVGPQHARKFAALMSEYKLPYFYNKSPKVATARCRHQPGVPLLR